MAKKKKQSDPIKDLKELDPKNLAKKLQPILERDPNWLLATCKIKKATKEDWQKSNLAITRITKKAIKLMLPNHKCSVRRGRGTASHWVYINLIIPELDPNKMRGAKHRYEYRKIFTKVETVLLALGIKYSSYYTDFGPGLNDWSPCLSVTVNSMG